MIDGQDRPRILILGGHGKVGQETARYLLSETGAELVLASRREMGMPGWVESADIPRVTMRMLDVQQAGPLRQACSRADLVVSCAGPSGEVGDSVALACKSMAVPLIDAGGYDPLLHGLELDQQRESSRVPLIINAGLLPGLSGLFPRWMIEARGGDARVAQLEVHYVGRDAWTYNSAWDIVHSLGGFGTDRGFCHLRDRVLVREPFRRARRRVAFPEPIGSVSTMLVYSEEIMRLARQHDIGDVRVYGANIGPRATLVCVLAKLLGWYRTRRGIARGAAWLAGASARDMRRLAPAYAIHVELHCQSGGDDSATLTLTDTYRATGAVIGIAARLLLEGQGPEPGVHMLHEAVPPGRVIQHLREQGLIHLHGRPSATLGIEREASA